MSQWVAKRFWSEVTVEPAAQGFAVRLDGRPLRTPAKRNLTVPTEPLALRLAEEWRAQADAIDPSTMPVTRSANAAIDKVAPQHAEVAANLAAYGETDLLCYRAESPDALTWRQAEAWDPLLDWAAEALDARLVPVAGVMPRDQDQAALQRLSERVHAMDHFALTGFHDLVMLSGSLVLAFAVTERRLSGEAAWELSRLDESWQVEQWGRDAEAEASARIKRAAFLHAERFHDWALDRP